MVSLAARAALLLLLVLYAPAARAAVEREPLRGAWWVATQLRVSAAMDDGAGFALPARPLLANAVFDSSSGRFGVSLLRPDELWLLQTGTLELDDRGDPRLVPQGLVESGVAELVCAELAYPAPCDAPLESLAIEVIQSQARARIRGNVVRIGGRLRLAIFDPARPTLRIRVGVAYEGRAEQSPRDTGEFELAAAR